MYNIDKVLIGMVGLLLALTIVVGCVTAYKTEAPHNSEVCEINTDKENC